MFVLGLMYTEADTLCDVKRAAFVARTDANTCRKIDVLLFKNSEHLTNKQETCIPGFQLEGQGRTERWNQEF